MGEPDDRNPQQQPGLGPVWRELSRHGERIATVEACVQGINGTLAEVHKDLKDHCAAEDANLGAVRRDVHYLRGVMEERARHQAKNPIVRLVLWILSLFGLKLPPGA